MDDWMNRKMPDVLRTIFNDYIHVCIICYILYLLYLYAPFWPLLKLLAQLPCKHVPKKGTDDIGKDAMLVYTVSNMYFYTWLQHIYMFMFETVLLCSLWFPSISVPS